MEFKNTYSNKFGLPFEKIQKDGKEYVRYINSDELYEYSHQKVDAEYTQDPLIALAGYIQRSQKKFPNAIIDLSGAIALSCLTRTEFTQKEKDIYNDVYKGEKENYSQYKSAIENFRGENLFYILTPGIEQFYKNEPLIIIDNVKDVILTFGWHIHKVSAETITDILFRWESIHETFNNFKLH